MCRQPLLHSHCWAQQLMLQPRVVWQIIHTEAVQCHMKSNNENNSGEVTSIQPRPLPQHLGQTQRVKSSEQVWELRKGKNVLGMSVSMYVPPYYSLIPGWCHAANSGVDSQMSCSLPLKTHHCRHTQSDLCGLTMILIPLSEIAFVPSEWFSLKEKLDNGEECVKANKKQWIFRKSVLTIAVSFVWGSKEAALTKGFAIHRDSHSPGCGLYSTQDKMMHFILCPDKSIQHLLIVEDTIRQILMDMLLTVFSIFDI